MKVGTITCVTVSINTHIQEAANIANVEILICTKNSTVKPMDNGIKVFSESKDHKSLIMSCFVGFFFIMPHNKYLVSHLLLFCACYLISVQHSTISILLKFSIGYGMRPIEFLICIKGLYVMNEANYLKSKNALNGR